MSRIDPVIGEFFIHFSTRNYTICRALRYLGENYYSPWEAEFYLQVEKYTNTNISGFYPGFDHKIDQNDPILDYIKMIGPGLKDQILCQESAKQGKLKLIRRPDDGN